MKSSRRQFLHSVALGSAALAAPRSQGAALLVGYEQGGGTTPSGNTTTKPAGSPEAAKWSTQLFAAIRAGDQPKITELLRIDPVSRSVTDDAGRSLLWIAAAGNQPGLFPLLRTDRSKPDIFDAVVTGDTKRIYEIQQADPAALNQIDRFGWTPLLAACDAGQGVSVEALMGIGADSRLKRPDGETPLMLALRCPRTDARQWMVGILLANGTDPNAPFDGNAPLHLAAARADEFSIRLLLRKGADPASTDKEGRPPRGITATSRLTRDSEEPVSRTHRRGGGADILIANPPGLPQTFIDRFVTVAHFDLKETQRLLRLCPDLLNTRAIWDELAVEGPAHLGNLPNTRFLLDQGAPCSLCTAVMIGDEAEIQTLLAADPRAVQGKGPHDFGLIWYTAFGEQKPAIAEKLVAAGADVNANVRGRSVLHEAAARGHAELLELLLQKGADANLHSVSTFQPGTPLAVALRRKQARAADVLRKYGARE